MYNNEINISSWIDRIIKSKTPPRNKQVLWLDLSRNIKILRVYLNGRWIPINRPIEEYVLPTASDTVKGGIKIGDRLYMEEQTLYAEEQIKWITIE